MVAPLLFAEYDLFSTIQNQEKAVRDAIERVTSEVLACSSVDAEVGRLRKEFEFTVPVLDEDGIEIKQQDTTVEVSERPDMVFFDRGPHYRPAVEYSFFVPFKGDPDLLRCRPSQFHLSPPRAEVGRDELIVSHTGLTPDIEPAKATLKSTLEQVKLHLEWVQSDVAKFNSNLRGC